VATIAALSPYHEHYATHEVTDGDDALLLIVKAVINHIQRLSFKNECGILKGEATFVECEVPFHWVERKFHLFIVSPKNGRVLSVSPANGGHTRTRVNNCTRSLRLRVVDPVEHLDHSNDISVNGERNGGKWDQRNP
jgi:hypothetical protein